MQTRGGTCPLPGDATGTDGQQAAANSRSYCVAVRSAKNPKPKPAGPSTSARTIHICVPMTVYNCGTQYSTEQTIITAQMTFIGGRGTTFYRDSVEYNCSLYSNNLSSVCAT